MAWSVLAAVDGRPAGVIGVAGTMKEGSTVAAAALRARGIEVVMMTGDNRAGRRVFTNPSGKPTAALHATERA
ncbi:MAG TPA: hypothetical protein VFJ22_12855 [Dermatophilaceae bacterium]|nr:hypothetical protein [Dermatophilaceae bacterium]